MLRTIKEKLDQVLANDSGKPGYNKDNKFAVFKSDGDAIKSGSTRVLGNAVKDACAALMKDWQPDSDRPGEGRSR